MLRTNSKQAMENIRNYIKEHSVDYLEDNYGYDAEYTEKNGFFTTIYDIFVSEERPFTGYNARRPEYESFKNWAQGLAMGSLFCYYYNRSAKDDLAGILEETEEEKNRFSEEQAEEKLSQLIYTRIKSEAGKEEEQKARAKK